MKRIVLIFLILLLTMISIHYCKRENRPDIKIPILLYHDFVKVVPETDPDHFQYIYTPEGFEENIKTLQNQGYTFLSFHELNDVKES